jgi:hypothetical protein
MDPIGNGKLATDSLCGPALAVGRKNSIPGGRTEYRPRLETVLVEGALPIVPTAAAFPATCLI